MEVAEMDALVNGASIDSFGEAAVFDQGGESRVIFYDVLTAIELGLASVDAPTPVISLPMSELQRLGATEGSIVTVRGVVYTLMEGATDPVADFGGMAHLRLRPYA